MTERQRAALLALPDSEAAVVRHHGLEAEDLAAIGTARTPATRLSYALQLCCLRYPGRHLRAGELLPAIMLDHIAEQVGVDADAVADFARRPPTRYDQLAAIKARFGFTDLSRPARSIIMTWLETEAMPIVDGRILLNRLLDELRTRRIVIPGISVVERMAAEAMLRAETDLVAVVDEKLDADMRQHLDTLVDEKVHDRQSRLSWLREPEPRVASASLNEILEKVALIQRTGIASVPVDPLHEPRLTQFAREGVRYTAQAFQQMRASRRRVILLACYGMLPATRITDVLSQVERWTGFTRHFGHVSTGLPPTDERAFLATLIAEATNLGLSRMAEVCGAGSRSLTENIDTTTPGGMLVFNIFGSLAQFERDLIRERTQAGLRTAHERGSKGGRRPVVTPDKLRKARTHIAAGLTVREAAARLKIGKTALYKALGQRMT